MYARVLEVFEHMGRYLEAKIPFLNKNQQVFHSKKLFCQI